MTHHPSAVIRRHRGAILGLSAGLAVCAALFLTAWGHGPQHGSAAPVTGGVPRDEVRVPRVIGSGALADAHRDGRTRAEQSKVATRRRVGAKDVLVTVPAPTVEPSIADSLQAPGSAPVPTAAPELPGATVVPDAGSEAAVAEPVASAATVDAVPAPTQPAAPAAAAQPGAVRLRISSLEQGVTRAGDPQLAVGLDVAGADADVPEHVTLRLRPTLPAAAETDPGALALRAQVDVVDTPAANGATSAEQPLAMRVRMAVVESDTTTTTVADRGEGDGHSNIVEVTAPLDGFAPEAGQGSSPAAGSDDQAGAPEVTAPNPSDAPALPAAEVSPQPATSTPAATEPQPEPAAAQTADAELLLPLDPAGDAPPTETAALPMPGATDAADEGLTVDVTLVAPMPQPEPTDPAPAAETTPPLFVGDPASSPDAPTPVVEPATGA